MDVSTYCSLYTGGKEAMAGEVGKFNQAASLAYKALDAKNKGRPMDPPLKNKTNHISRS